MEKVAINLDGTGKKVGIVMSRFNSEIGEGLLRSCYAELLKLGVVAEDICIATVAGALETPLILQHMALSEQYDALIALGAVVRGETYHFEVVANESARGVCDVQLSTGIPVANAILTTENDEQAMDRVEVKGTEAAQVAIEMANLVHAL
ncbi:MAG: 6,7-dimethyl-8-ribityllumazine synthase [Methylophilaceae bacterium]|nr:MAG: 6,7-dimethyl-8-ribityllumazine synthase [Methylophilaceae bacterium]